MGISWRAESNRPHGAVPDLTGWAAWEGHLHSSRIRLPFLGGREGGCGEDGVWEQSEEEEGDI